MSYDPVTYGYYDDFNARGNRLYRLDLKDLQGDVLDTEEKELTPVKMDPDDPKFSGAESYQFLKLAEGYSADYSDYSSSDVQTDPQKKDDPEHPEDSSLLQVSTEQPKLTILKDSSPEDSSKVDDQAVTIKPPDLIDLYNEASTIPYGIPRLHHYPLDSRKNCIRALNGIRGCNNIYDRQALIENLTTVNESMGYGLTIPDLQDVVNEAHGVPWSELSKEDRQKEKLNMAREYLNTRYYFPDGIGDNIERYPFMEYFYPNLGRIEFPIRAKYMCGGIFTDDSYDPSRNWFEVSLADDSGHIEYCEKLYEIIGHLLEGLYVTDTDYPYLMDWRQRVCYHYDRLQEETVGSTAYLKEAQYLFDLCWSILDDPYVEGNIENARRWFFCTIVQRGDVTVSMNERVADDDSELYHKDPIEEYLVDTLPLSGEDYLLPSTREFPIVNQNSVKLAMDIIDSIPKDQQEEYARNLNRKYEEFYCRFEISADHPFAPFAKGRIRANRTLPLLLYDVALRESATAVDDQGTSDAGPAEPWIRRVDQRGGADSDHEFYPDTELGPNVGKDNQDDFTRHYSIL